MLRNEDVKWSEKLWKIEMEIIVLLSSVQFCVKTMASYGVNMTKTMTRKTDS